MKRALIGAAAAALAASGMAVTSGGALASAASTPGATRADAAGVSSAAGFVDGDAFEDVVVGVPGEDVGDKVDAGAIVILYGGEAGFPARTQTVNQNLAGGLAEDGDQFGSAISVDDFDGDGLDDVAVGAPFEDVGTVVDAGNVTIVYGGVNGATGRATPVNQGTVGGAVEAEDHFGQTLETGSWRNDIYGDLAVGAPDEDGGDLVDSGNVTVIYGDAAGPGRGGVRVLSQGATGVRGEREAGDRFGFSLQRGNYNTLDEFNDLAIGAPGEDAGDVVDSGNVTVVYGNETALGSTSDVLRQGGGAPETSETGDNFGWSLAAGSFDENIGATGLAIGVPGEGIGGVDQAGKVVLVYPGINSIVGGPPSRGFNQNDVGEDPESFDRFGETLTAGIFSLAPYADLLVGSPFEDVGAAEDAGMVSILFGSSRGITPVGSVNFDQSGLGGVPDAGDNFGASLAFYFLNGPEDAFGEFAVGAPGENIEGADNAGVVTVHYNDPAPPIVADNYTQTSSGGLSEQGDLFGAALG